MSDLYFGKKPVYIKAYAVKRARERNIAYPDQVYGAIKTGKVERFGKNGISLSRM